MVITLRSNAQEHHNYLSKISLVFTTINKLDNKTNFQHQLYHKYPVVTNFQVQIPTNEHGGNIKNKGKSYAYTDHSKPLINLIHVITTLSPQN